MRKKINQTFLKQLKQKSIPIQNHRFYQFIHQKSANLISQTLLDIKRPFQHICLHSQSAAHIVRQLIQNQNQTINQCTIQIADQFNNHNQINTLHTLIRQANITNISVEIGVEDCIQQGLWKGNQEKYDLIISDLQLHTCQNPQNLLNGYKSSLKKDGALVGCCYGQGTLRELYWSYMMAENQRSGGVSPKVATFPSMGVLGNLLTSCHFNLSTIMDIEQTVFFQSVLDLLSVIQDLGESGYLEGRRKGVYKDVLLAMCALYEAQFRKTNPQQQEKDCVYASIEMLNFIGWKYSQEQPKPLKKGQKSANFVDELREVDGELKHYRINDSDDKIQQIK